MTYTLLALLGVAAAVGWDGLLLRTRVLRTHRFWTTYALLLGFQLLANGTLTGLHVVRYNPHAITGLRLAYAPIEDIGFGFALITITLSCWTWTKNWRVEEEQPLSAADDSTPTAPSRRDTAEEGSR